MKHFAFLSLFIPWLCQAQDENHLLWKISSPNASSVSYLFGTIHSNDSLVNSFDSIWWNAFHSCEIFAGEVSFYDPENMQAGLSAVMMKDQLLSDLYAPEEWKEVEHYLSENLSEGERFLFSRLKPFYLLAYFMERPDPGQSQAAVMDQHIQEIAHEKKRIVGLETMAEQAQAVDAISLHEQASLLLEYIRGPQHESMDMASLLKAYRAQDLKLLAETQEEWQLPDAFNQSLVEARNRRFAERLVPLLLQGDVFCAVGALHLPGDTGLIQSLRAAGFQVVPVDFHFIRP